MIRRISPLLGLLALLSCRPTADGDEKPAKPAPVKQDDKGVAADTATADRTSAAAGDLAARADALAHRLLIMDGHIDLPYRLDVPRDEAGKLAVDLFGSETEGDFDFPRAKKGGLDAPFIAVFVGHDLEEKGGAKIAAERSIGLMEEVVKRSSKVFAHARSPAEVRANFAQHKVSLPLGMENGAPLEGQIENVAYFHGRGIRYITLCHSRSNHISDSSFDEKRKWNGLSPFGKKVVAEMNRVGVMIDVSHVSDEAFFQVIELSKTPVIASHSSCRHFTPGWERNMSDEMIEKLAKNGGVIQITFGSAFVDDDARKHRSKRRQALRELLAAKGLEHDSPEAKAIVEDYDRENPQIRATVEKVADHIDHVVKLVGIDHVGFGSDFNGVGDSLPTGLEDVSAYPNLVRVLLERGYTEPQIAKICSENLLRVWQAVEDHAKAAG
jgi:membrane dipeptidase